MAKFCKKKKPTWNLKSVTFYRDLAKLATLVRINEEEEKQRRGRKGGDFVQRLIERIYCCRSLVGGKKTAKVSRPTHTACRNRPNIVGHVMRVNWCTLHHDQIFRCWSDQVCSECVLQGVTMCLVLRAVRWSGRAREGGKKKPRVCLPAPLCFWEERNI